MTNRCEQDRHAQGPDGYVFDDSFDRLSLDAVTDDDFRKMWEAVTT